MRNRTLIAGVWLGLLAWTGCPSAPNVDTQTPGDTTGTDDTSAASRAVSGTIVAPANAKWAPRGQDADQGFRVSVVSADTLREYTGTSDAEGNFNVEIPDDETGDLFMVTVLDPQSRPLGPVMFDHAGDSGMTGLELDGPADLGTLALPEDPFAAPIIPGDDADLGDASVPDDVTVRLNGDGVAIGVPSLGKGDDANGDPTDNPRQRCDRDRDGLIDAYDADNDGNGIVDDFEPAGAADNPAERDGLVLNFFMNLKLDGNAAQAFFDGDTGAIAEALKQLTVITFEVRGTMPPVDIESVRVIGPPAPSPAYLTDMVISNSATKWMDDGFALQPDSGVNHFQQWVVPTDIINAGDTFTIEVTFVDGSIGVYSRMINYVFKSIPKPLNMGDPNNPAPYTGPAELVFDGNRDLLIEWNPPVDERGSLITGIPYFFEIFYQTDAHTQVHDIDGEATWTTPIDGFDRGRQVFEVNGSDLTALSADNSFTVRLPKELFVDTVQTADGPVAVTSYKIDIAAQANGNNAAFMLPARKAP